MSSKFSFSFFWCPLINKISFCTTNRMMACRWLSVWWLIINTFPWSSYPPRKDCCYCYIWWVWFMKAKFPFNSLNFLRGNWIRLFFGESCFLIVWKACLFREKRMWKVTRKTVKISNLNWPSNIKDFKLDFYINNQKFSLTFNICVVRFYSFHAFEIWRDIFYYFSNNKCMKQMLFF